MSHGRVRHEVEIYVVCQPMSGVGPDRYVSGRLIAWDDGRWRVTIPMKGGPPVIVDGDETTAVTHTVATLVATMRP